MYVATHKKIDFEIPNYCKKIQVNAERNGQWEGYLHDNDNPDNISLKNPNYCELTALYAMWKNCDADIQGLFHYRRYISDSDIAESSEQIIFSPSWRITVNSITEQKIIQTLITSDVIINFPYIPYPLDSFEDRRRFVYRHDIQEMCRVISEYYPDYIPYLDSVFDSVHMCDCNLFIAKREFVNEYCTWLFDVLGRIEGKISLEGYDRKHSRIYGYLSEVLLNVYIHRHNLKCRYFRMTRLYEKSFLRYPLYLVKKALKKIPWLFYLQYAMSPEKSARVKKNMRKYSKLRYESLMEFLAGRKRIFGRKVTDASGLKDYINFLGFSKTECLESDSLIYVFVDLGYSTDNGVIVIFIPKSESKLNNIPDKIQFIIREKEASFEDDTVVLPRIILNGEIDSVLKDKLIESGCRIFKDI